MILKKNIGITAKEKEMMADKAIELMVDYTETTSDKNVLTCFDVENAELPREHMIFNPWVYEPCVAVPPDIVGCIHEKFILQGYYIYVCNGRHIVMKREICPIKK